jgi:hypothetical protein
VNFISVLPNLFQVARVSSRSEHGDVVLLFRSIKDVFEIDPNGVITIQILSGMGFQDERVESAALAFLVGEVVMEHSVETGAIDFEGSLAVRPRGKQSAEEEHWYREFAHIEIGIPGDHRAAR